MQPTFPSPFPSHAAALPKSSRHRGVGHKKRDRITGEELPLSPGTRQRNALSSSCFVSAEPFPQCPADERPFLPGTSADRRFPQSPPGGSGVPSPQPHLAPPHQLCVQVSSSVLRQPTSNSVPKISTTQMMEAWEADKGKGLEEERYGQRGSRIPSILCVHAHLNEAQVKRL